MWIEIHRLLVRGQSSVQAALHTCQRTHEWTGNYAGAAAARIQSEEAIWCAMSCFLSLNYALKPFKITKSKHQPKESNNQTSALFAVIVIS